MGYKRRNGKKVTFQGIVKEILDTPGAVDKIGAAVASLDPFHVAGVGWAGIQFFVQASVNNAATRNLVLNDQTYVAVVIQYCATTENEYLPTPHQGPGPRLDLQNAIVKLYEKILIYNMQAVAYLERTRISITPGTGSAIAAASLDPDNARGLKKTIYDIVKIYGEVDACKQNVQQLTLNTMNTTVGTVKSTVDDIWATLSRGMGQQLSDDPPELFFFGSDKSCALPSPADEIDDLAKDPSWLRLLKFFGETFTTTHPPYVETELRAFEQDGTGLKERSVDSLTMWRILCSTFAVKVRPYSKHHNEAFVGPMRLFVLHDRDKPCIQAEWTGGHARVSYIPSLEMTKQILRDGSVIPGGPCGEKYILHERDEEDLEFEVQASYSLCMTQFSHETRYYPRLHLKWAWLCFRYLSEIVRGMWIEGMPDLAEIESLCQRMRDEGLRPAAGPEKDADLDTNTLWWLPQAWKGIAKGAKAYFESTSTEFEVQDVIYALRLMRDQMDNIEQIRRHVEISDQDAPWLMLALLLNLVWNLAPSAVIPDGFEALLEKPKCVLC